MSLQFELLTKNILIELYVCKNDCYTVIFMNYNHLYW